jgi:hypothetical protein
MPSSYTTSLRLTLPATGELAGQWGTTVNTGITELLDSAVAGTTTISTWGGAGVAYTLSNNSGTADEARRMFIVATGTPGEAKNVICPAVSKFYVFRNDTTGGFALTLKTPSGTGIAVPAGQYKFLYCNGTDVVEAFNSAGALTLSGALSVGGTATFAANPTLSAGTANGVTYLNGSKVLTSGSALTFDGTGQVTLNSGANAVLKLNATFGSGASIIDLTASGSTAQDTRIVGGSGSTSNISFVTSGSEQMRLTSTGLGIGTSSPGTKLDVSGADVYRVFRVSTTTGGVIEAGLLGQSTIGIQSLSNAGNFQNLLLQPNGGNLGIGTSSPATKLHVNKASQTPGDTTPSGALLVTNTLAGAAGVEIGSGSSVLGYLQVRNTTNQTYYDFALQPNGGNVGIGTNSPIAGYGLTIGNDSTGNTTVGLAFSTSAAERGSVSMNATLGELRLTAGYAGYGGFQTFYANGSERMRLDSSGNLGLGVTPSAWSGLAAALQVQNASIVTSSTGAVDTNFSSNAYYNSGWKYIISAAATQYIQNATGDHRWYTAPSGTAGNAISFTQAMTLDASGNLALGQTSASYRLDVLSGADVAIRARANNNEVLRVESTGTTGSYIRFINTADNLAYIGSASGALNFLTNNTERARITSGGDLWVGTATAISPGSLTANNVLSAGTSSQWAAAVRNSTTGTPWGLAIQYSAAAPNDTSSTFLYCLDSGPTLRASIRSNGGLANYQANDVNLSDRREKTNFAPAKDYLDTICAIPVQTFNYIDQAEDDPGLTLGVVAQDVQAVAPELVMESNWGTEDNPKMRLSIYQTDLQYALMKCIQEQQALITDLRARVAALEA